MVPVRRYARHWLAYLAGGGLVLILGASTPLDRPTPSRGNAEAQYQASPTQEHKHSQNAESHSPKSPSVQKNQTTCEGTIAAQPEGECHWYARPDWWVAGFTGLLFFATGGLWFFTALLWLSTRQAVKDTANGLKHAEASAKAAARQAEISEAALLAINRPIMVLEPSVDETNSYNHVTDNTFPFFQFSYRNHGVGGAVVKERFARLLPIKRDLTVADFAQESVAWNLPAYFFITPGQAIDRFTIVAYPWDESWQPEVADGRLRLFVFGKVKYEGALGYRHETSFCWRYYPEWHQFREDADHPELNRRT